MIGGFALPGLASVLVLSFTLQTTTPPRTENPHDVPAPTEQTAGCDGVLEYADLLFTTFSAHEEFADFWSNGDPDALQLQDREVLQGIVDDGRTLLDELDVMETPELYALGHEGLMLLFDSEIEWVYFEGIDATAVPDFDQWNRGLALLLDGEIALLESCPDEVEELGGHLFFPIDVIEEALGI